MVVSCPAGSFIEHRFELEAVQLAIALRHYLRLKGVVAENPNHYVARDAYVAGIDICGLVALEETSPDEGMIYVTAPGAYFSDFDATGRSSIDRLIQALGGAHRLQVVPKHELQVKAFNKRGRRCQVQLRPNRGLRPEYSRKKFVAADGSATGGAPEKLEFVDGGWRRRDGGA